MNRNASLPEVSGLSAGNDGDLWVHNDDGKPALYALGADGEIRRTLVIREVRNRDWEDMTLVPINGQQYLLIADTGDNERRRKSVQLIAVPLPLAGSPGDRPAEVSPGMTINLRYPDGPHDVESVAWDPAGSRILLITKRDLPPRLYAVPLADLQDRAELTVKFMGEIPTLRPPTPLDLVKHPGRGAWVSQPTGLAISPDGTIAAVLTYRSLYFYDRESNEGWEDAFLRRPVEIVGPPGLHDEAVTFEPDGEAVVVMAEGVSKPIYRLQVPTAGGNHSTERP